MDWAEELKLTIKKKARKGRRLKSRDVLKDQSGTSKDISIAITLDVHNEGTSPTSTYNNEFDSSRPPIRRVSGGWADGGLKNFKSKKNSFDDERFQATKSTTSTIPTDDIPIIPDLDDIKEDILLNEIVQTLASDTSVAAFKETKCDLLSQTAFLAVGLDLSILTRSLQNQESLDEQDEPWEWEKIFTEVTAQINSDRSLIIGVPENVGIGPDEVPPASKYN